MWPIFTIFSNRHRKPQKRDNIYKKLVRDKIPKILSQKSISYFTKTLQNNEYLEALYKKLQEEVNELFASNNDDNWLEEMADMLEVLKTLLKVKKRTFNELERTCKEKGAKKGGFNKRIFLEKTVEKFPITP